jgi:3-hydroxymyristoyl/3-hydroxydecanoyl-(acyl carrier protein) dehydratase
MIEGRNMFKVSSQRVDTFSWTTTLIVSSNHPIFDVHFPEFALVPGAFFLEVVGRSAIAAVAPSLRASFVVKEIKLLSPIRPNSAITLMMQAKLMGANMFRVVFSATGYGSSTKTVFSRGVLEVTANLSEA